MADSIRQFTSDIIKHEASFRGSPFFIKSSGVEGGRKDSKKEFVNTDRQLIEDLGKKQRVFTINGCIAERRDSSNTLIMSYIQARDGLINALEKGGTGVLIHPWYGRIDNIVCRVYSISENVNVIGIADISITFEISNTDGIPVASEFGRTRVSKFHENLMETIEKDLSEIFIVTSSATGNFTAAKDKLDSLITNINAATDPIAAVADEINKHTNYISNFSADISTLISAPVDLADRINGALDSIGGLYSTAKGTLEAFKNLFDFGDDDIDSPQITSISIERKNNNDVINSTIRAGALSFSYLNASDIEYQTVDEITEQASDLEVQYQKLFDDPLVNEEVIDALTDLRLTTQGFFDEQKLTVSKIITIRSNPMSTRLLAFYNYGTSARGEEIAELNEFYDLALQQGNIKVFSA